MPQAEFFSSGYNTFSWATPFGLRRKLGGNGQQYFWGPADFRFFIGQKFDSQRQDLEVKPERESAALLP